MSPRRKPSTRQIAYSRATHFSAVRSASRLVLCNPRESIPRTQRTTIDDLAAARSTSGYSSSRPASVCCLESFRRESERRSDSVSSSRSKRTAAATSGPARQPRPASSAPATKRRSKLRSYAKRRRPVRAGRRLERADAAWGPVGEEGASDDPFLRNGTPVAAIVALSTVVAHHKKVVRRNLDRLPQIAEFIARRALRDERLLLLDERPGSALGEVDVVVLDLDPIARERDDALDEVVVRLVGRRLLAGPAVGRLARDAALLAVGALRRLEDDDVAAARISEVRAEAVHENALTDLERRHHRRARDPERLDEECLDADREAQGDGDDHDELDRRVARALLPLFLLGLVHGRHDGP